MKWLNKLEWKYGRFAIPNLMLAIVIGMFTMYVAELMFPQIDLSSYFAFDRNLLFQGQIWRLISFVVLPLRSHLLFILLSLYFYYMIGSALERTWGSFKFNIYYLCGMIGTILGGMITGHAENSYLNLSLFFAFAALFPETEIRLFFLIPIKIKYLAMLDGVFFLYILIIGSGSDRAAILASLINFFLFFGKDFFNSIKLKTSTYKARRNFKNSMRR